MSSAGTPTAEFVIDEQLVGKLLAEQHADLAHLPLVAVDSGWDNTLFRLGEHFLLRLPRRSAAAALINHEQRWLPHLANQLTLPIPVPYRVGVPGCGYPWSWSIVPWLSGNAADQHQPLPQQAFPFAGFLRSLHTVAPADAPHNPVRGGPLRERAPFAEARLQRLANKTACITQHIWQLWHEAVDIVIDLPPTWLHGDLHPRNVLVEQGVISAVIDWGDITSGDPATDLAAFWMLFDDADVRQAALTMYGEVSAATLARARGWALHFAAILLDTGLVDNPRNARIGERILYRLDGGH